MVFIDVCFFLTMLILLLFFCIFFMLMLRESDEDTDQLPEKCVDLFWEIQRRAFEALWDEIRERFKEIREFLIAEVGDVSIFEDEAIFRIFVDVQREWKRCEEYFKTEDSQRYACTGDSTETDKEAFMEAARMVDYFEDLVDQMTDMVIEKKRAEEAGTAPNYVYKFEKGNIGGSEKEETEKSEAVVCNSFVEEMNIVTPTKNDLVKQKPVEHNAFEQETMTDCADTENIVSTATTEETSDNFNMALTDVMEMLKSRLEEIRSSPSAAPLTNLEAELPSVVLKLLDSVHASLVPSSSLSLASSSEISEALLLSSSLQIPPEFSKTVPFAPFLATLTETSEPPQDSDNVNPAVNKSNNIDVESEEYSSDDDSDWSIVSSLQTPQ